MTDSSSLLASLTDSFMDISASLINLLAIRYAMALPTKSTLRPRQGGSPWRAGAVGLHLGSALLLDDARHLVDAESGARGAPGGRDLGQCRLHRADPAAGELPGFGHPQDQQRGHQGDMLHYRSDLLLNGGVLVALVLAGAGVLADGLFAILIGLFLVGAVHIGYESVQALLDRQLPEEEQARIMALCCAVEGCMAYMTCVPANPG